MPYNVLIVEDQPIIAMNLEDAVEALGHRSIGIASNLNDALSLASGADLAFVDVNLDDGPTGVDVGRVLAERDVAVLFMTSDPAALGGGVPGTLGVIEKPLLNLEMVQAIEYAAGRRAGTQAVAPRKLVRFDA